MNIFYVVVRISSIRLLWIVTCTLTFLWWMMRTSTASSSFRHHNQYPDMLVNQMLRSNWFHKGKKARYKTWPESMQNSTMVPWVQFVSIFSSSRTDYYHFQTVTTDRWSMVYRYHWCPVNCCKWELSWGQEGCWVAGWDRNFSVDRITFMGFS